MIKMDTADAHLASGNWVGVKNGLVRIGVHNELVEEWWLQKKQRQDRLKIRGAGGLPLLPYVRSRRLINLQRSPSSSLTAVVQHQEALATAVDQHYLLYTPKHSASQAKQRVLHSHKLKNITRNNQDLPEFQLQFEKNFLR